MKLASIETIVDDARNGKLFVLGDDQNRENEGDLIFPAQLVTPDIINFMAKYGRGLICLALAIKRADTLELKNFNDCKFDLLTNENEINLPNLKEGEKLKINQINLEKQKVWVDNLDGDWGVIENNPVYKTNQTMFNPTDFDSTSQKFGNPK